MTTTRSISPILLTLCRSSAEGDRVAGDAVLDVLREEGYEDLATAVTRRLASVPRPREARAIAELVREHFRAVSNTEAVATLNPDTLSVDMSPERVSGQYLAPRVRTLLRAAGLLAAVTTDRSHYLRVTVTLPRHRDWWFVRGGAVGEIGGNTAAREQDRRTRLAVEAAISWAFPRAWVNIRVNIASI